LGRCGENSSTRCCRNGRDLERKLAEFQAYYNAARRHVIERPHTPMTFGSGHAVPPADLLNVRWSSPQGPRPAPHRRLTTNSRPTRQPCSSPSNVKIAAAKPRRRICPGSSDHPTERPGEVCRIRETGSIRCIRHRPSARELTGTTLETQPEIYGRNGTPTDVVNRCKNRDGESLTLAATAFNDTASASASLLEERAGRV
jgi:hypothetical protein